MVSVVILVFNIYVVCSLGRRMIYFGFFNVVYIYWDMQYGGESDKVCVNVVDG